MNYPLTPEHKKEHEDLVKAILGAVHEYESGHSFVPNKFARTLKDWVLSHIAVKDKAFGEYLGRHRSDPDAGAVRPEART